MSSKKISKIFIYLMLLVGVSCGITLVSCGDINYKKTVRLIDNYDASQVHYSILCKDENYNVTLENVGKITKLNEEEYKYEYSFQYLNSINSDSKELVSTIEDTITGSESVIKETINENNYDTNYGSLVIPASITKLIGNYEFVDNGIYVIMFGKLSTDKVKILVPDIGSEDINYSIMIDQDFKKIIEMKINYSTTIFESVSIVINYN